MWMVSGISAGLLLGFYDFWTKKAMDKNTVIPVVFWTSIFGFVLWLPAVLTLHLGGYDTQVILAFDLHQQALIFVRALSMTVSWILAFYATRELPMSFTGAVRASGPIWALLGGSIFLQEYLTPLQIAIVLISVGCYYVLSQIGKSEGIHILRSRPMLLMAIATILSSLTTVYDKFVIHNLEQSIYTVQFYSSFYRLLISSSLLLLLLLINRNASVKWSIWIPLVGFSWVIAEYIYFLAVQSADSNATYLSIFRRMSLVVGFVLSVIYFKESNIMYKSFIVITILASTVALIFGFN
ncbi:hypothetical protein CQ054_22340 [Ochrobactrum sp. MYb29]|nr:hypothetical protein CQ054_22340 [Ochrobactrum sp. MYb29]